MNIIDDFKKHKKIYIILILIISGMGVFLYILKTNKTSNFNKAAKKYSNNFQTRYYMPINYNSSLGVSRGVSSGTSSIKTIAAINPNEATSLSIIPKNLSVSIPSMLHTIQPNPQAMKQFNAKNSEAAFANFTNHLNNSPHIKQSWGIFLGM